MIKVYVTFGELSSWLAISGLKSLVQATNVRIEWRPLLGSLGNVVSTNIKAGEADPLAQLKARRARGRTMASEREFSRQCEMLGITEEIGRGSVDPLMLSVGLNWLRQRKESQAVLIRFVEAAFIALFRDGGHNLESLEGVAELLAQLGCSADRFHEFAIPEAGNLEDQPYELLEQGILKAPAFVVEDQLFHGREHLPLITWMLSGRIGLPPV